MTSIGQAVSSAQKAIQDTLKASETQAKALVEAKQDASLDTLNAEMGENVSIAGQIKRTNKLEPRQEVRKTGKAKEVEESVLVRKEGEDLAEQFPRRQGNHEYHLDSGLLRKIVAEELGTGITEESTSEQIIAWIQKCMTGAGEQPDVVIIDKAFEFLLEFRRAQVGKVTGDEENTRLRKIIYKISDAREVHKKKATHTVPIKHEKTGEIIGYREVNDIETAHKIIKAVDAVDSSSLTGQSSKETLDHFRDIVHNPRPISDLRKFYKEKGKEWYKAMMLEYKGLNGFFRKEFAKEKIETPELLRLNGASQDMKALISPFREAKDRRDTFEATLKLNGVLAAAA